MNNPWEPVIVTHGCDDSPAADCFCGNREAGETQSETDREMGNSTAFHGPNAGYVVELYEQYLDDPESVGPDVRRFFADWTPPGDDMGAATAAAAGVDAARFIAVASYVNAIRRHGHRAAQLNPIGAGPVKLPEELQPETYQLRDEDLATLPGDAVPIWDGQSHGSALDAIEHLRRVYIGPIAFEFLHIQDPIERYWLREAAESGRYLGALTEEEKVDVLRRLTQVEAFERFLHQTYLGQKRFSIEGTDMMVPMLDQIIQAAVEQELESVVIGMAHRGRLNTLAHILEKPYDAIIGEFEHIPQPLPNGMTDLPPAHYSGDVKYHMGWKRGGENGHRLPIVMAPNPSHLEWVNPVVEGMARALQDDRSQPGQIRQDYKGALPVLLHGDAAFPGQGVVAETLNLARLEGYTTGGTIHIIANNQIGYTTIPQDGRSTLYSSDLAKGFEIPIIHVNADNPDACIAAVRIAMDYRERFHGDFLIDLIGYRRWGHNEGDEPTFTQPRMYEAISEHPTARAHWADELESTSVIESGQGDELLNAQMDDLQDRRDRLRDDHDEPEPNGHRPQEASRQLETEVSPDLLMELNEDLHSFPEDFTINRKLRRQLDRRMTALERDGGIDWAHAETLAFATILADAIPIRIAGQDTERGTFGQRHLVLHDPETGAEHSLLQHISPAKASFAAYNSPLSESGVLGFEYGYSVAAPEALVLWEAQFGDFMNSAQVIIDQFIASGASKWGQLASLVLLLPHGYEGQGPEHSSARLERFLQLAARDNIRVANMTTAGQYFHILRRQAKLLETDPRPLVIMTPKSLLRHPRAGASLRDLASGRFQPVIDDLTAEDRRKKVRRLVLCSGKVYVDLVGSDAYEETSEVAVVRVEELYPFPGEELQEVLGEYPNIDEVVWLQEEPRNMGAWTFMEPRLRELLDGAAPLRYIGRTENASPAEGSGDAHNAEQARIVGDAFAASRVAEESLADD